MYYALHKIEDVSWLGVSKMWGVLSWKKVCRRVKKSPLRWQKSIIKVPKTWLIHWDISLGIIWQLFMPGKALTKPWKASGLQRLSDFHYDVFKPAINVYLVLHLCNLYTILYLVVTWTVYEQANKYICLKSGLCCYLYASIGLYKTMKFVSKKRKKSECLIFAIYLL